MDRKNVRFVLVAGFSADHMEAMGLKKSLEKRGFGADAISFYGDGYIDDFTDLKISDCIANISGFINQSSEKYENVFGIGISLGGALLLEHAKDFNNLQGIASIGTPFKLKNKFWINFGQNFYPLIYPFWKRLQKIKRLRLSPIGAVKMVMEYFDTVLPRRLEAVRVPVLFLHSQNDPVSDGKILPKYLQLIASEKKDIIYFDSPNHVIHHDQDPDLIIKYILDFFGIS
jgi:esterase/lipase